MDGLNRTFIEEIDENSCCSHDYDMSISKAQGSTRGNLESHHWKKTS